MIGLGIGIRRTANARFFYSGPEFAEVEWQLANFATWDSIETFWTI